MKTLWWDILINKFKVERDGLQSNDAANSGLFDRFGLFTLRRVALISKFGSHLNLVLQ